jgi:ribulose-5-phosphate 4-epimerase/fuculose-1-phosphate aldolase
MANKPTVKDLVDDETLRKFVHACHILHYHGLVDAYGHLSYRVSDAFFLMSRYLAPALVSSVDDLVLYNVDDGEAIHADAPRGKL